MTLKYTKPTPISLKAHADFNEKWVQKRLAEDPSLLGLGDLILKDQERSHPAAGRLDLLFQEESEPRRYEVELQLGRTDESHIVRTIEYWDIERKRYPQYEHVAVIVAEDITSRFLNVISLFNGFIPLVAIQMTALQMDDQIALVFTKVLDQMQLGLVDDDEEGQEPTDRPYWEGRASKKSMALTDQLFEHLKAVDPGLALNYNKYYVGLTQDGQSNNFVQFNPKKTWVRVMIRLPKSPEIDALIDDAALDLVGYTRWGRYVIRVKPAELKEAEEALKQLMIQAYEQAR